MSASDLYSRAVELLERNTPAAQKRGALLMREAAERGNASAQFKLGFWYAAGKGGDVCAVDLDEAIRWYGKAAKGGSEAANGNLGIAYYRQKNYEKAIPLLRDAARMGYKSSQRVLGLCYKFGYGVQKDDEKAYRYFLKASDAGDKSAQYHLGLAFENGWGTERSLASAMRRYREAADQGHHDAMVRLGVMYYEGRGGDVRPMRAYKLFEKSLSEGSDHAESHYYLGCIYEKGIKCGSEKVDASKEKAILHFKAAASQGDKRAVEKLHEMGVKIETAKDNDAPLKKRDSALGTVDGDLDSLVGLESVKEEIRTLKRYLEVQKARAQKGLEESKVACHCVFAGNPGTGKTTVARILARIFKEIGLLKTDNLVETDRSGLVAEYIGQTAQKTNAVIDKALDGVLFIDEAYALANGSERDFGKEAVDTLLKRMEDARDRLVVIIAGYADEMRHFMEMNPGLQSRFNRTITFPNYNADELKEIFLGMARAKEYMCHPDVVLRLRDSMNALLAAGGKNFGNGRAVRNFFERVEQRMANRLPSDLKGVTREQLQTILVEDLDSPDEFHRQDVDKIIADLDLLIGLDPVKREVREMVEFIKAQRDRKSMGLKEMQISYHCVFTGNPGTGKTTVARMVAKIYKALGILKTDRVIEADRSCLVAGHVGQTAIKTNELVDSALDGVLFIDEAYTLANGGGNDFGQEAIDTLLKRMEDDRARLVVIVAGYTEEMKRFVRSNPGLESRFNRFIEFPDYTPAELTRIFKLTAAKNDYVVEGPALSEFEARMADVSGVESFGNGRYVRNFFERAIRRQGVRVNRMTSPTKDQRRELLVEDFDPVDE